MRLGAVAVTRRRQRPRIFTNASCYMGRAQLPSFFRHFSLPNRIAGAPPPPQIPPRDRPAAIFAKGHHRSDLRRTTDAAI